MKSTGKCLYQKPAIARWTIFHLIMLLPAGLILAIFLSSLLRSDGTTPGFEFIGLIPSGMQSGLHIPMFFGLTLVLLMTLKRFEKRKHNLILFTFVLGNYVGLLNEGLQMVIPGRHASLGDVGLNLVGTILGLITYFGIKNWKSAMKRGEGR